MLHRHHLYVVLSLVLVLARSEGRKEGRLTLVCSAPSCPGLLERSSLSKRYNNNTPTTTTALSLPHLAGGGGGGGAMHSSSPLPLSHPSLARPRFPSSSVVYTVSVLPVAEDEHDAGEGEDESEGEKEEEEKRAGGDVARRPLPC